MKGKIQPQADKIAGSLKDLGFTRPVINPISAITSNGKGDDNLALQMAQELANQNKSLVPGNHLQSSGRTPAVPVVHYATSAGSPLGFSLGDWGPVDVKGSDGQRDGAPVFTFEVFDNPESGAFRDDGIQIVGEDGKTPLRPEFAAAARKWMLVEAWTFRSTRMC